jgi:Second Messenger Oligonucleotide or Dinucleotide Synthetase domain
MAKFMCAFQPANIHEGRMNSNTINALANNLRSGHPTFLTSRKMQLVGVLERLCQEIELTDAQFEQARRRYEGVGTWLAAATDPLLQALIIYVQGSTALGTTVRPLGRNEHDVDLIALGRHSSTYFSPSAIKLAVGRRLRENGHYAPLLEEKPRCWRLTYANEFHLDITPSVPNHACSNGGELVPDKKVQEWKPTNPKGYRSLFDRRAQLIPRLRPSAHDRAMAKGAEVEAFPAADSFKGTLRRIVQVAKRHRDIHFENIGTDLSPISVILTTLLSQSYEYCVTQFIYDTEFDLFCDVLRRMPLFIEQRTDSSRTTWFVWNETTRGENFAEKWNADSRLPQAFYAWHAQAMTDIERLAELDGFDTVTKHLGGVFGSSIATKVMNGMTASITASRTAGRLRVAPVVGLTTAVGASTPVRANTFFGTP